MKKIIKKVKKDFKISTMVLSYEGALLADNQVLRDRNLSQSVRDIIPPTGDDRSNQIEKSHKGMTFLLTLCQGKCALDVILSMGQNSQEIELVVPSAICILRLQKMILRQAEKSCPALT